MAQALVYFRTGNYIWDHMLYSRNLAPVQFDGIGSGLALLSKPGLPAKTRLSIITVAPSLHYVRDNFGNNHVCSGEKNRYSVPNVSYTVSLIQVNEVKKTVFYLKADLASCISSELYRSRSFRRKFFKHVRHKVGFHFVDRENPQTDSTDIYPCDNAVWIPYIVEIWVEYCHQQIDYLWCYRMEGQAARRMLLEDAMAWLSTLGGGYASLGDYFHHHAKEAGKISIKQLKIAVEMGDPIIAAKCQIFFAQSYMQQGHYQLCKKIIRHQYQFAVSQVVVDDRLVATCKGVWTRLQYLYRIRHENNQKQNKQDHFQVKNLQSAIVQSP